MPLAAASPQPAPRSFLRCSLGCFCSFVMWLCCLSVASMEKAFHVLFCFWLVALSLPFLQLFWAHLSEMHNVQTVPLSGCLKVALVRMRGRALARALPAACLPALALAGWGGCRARTQFVF